MVSKWQKFLKLSWPEMSYLFLAFFLLPVSALALKLMGLRRTQILLMRLTPSPRRHGEIDRDALDQSRSRAIANLVRAAASHGPYRANCLKQSLTLWWLLRLRGIGSVLRIGVRKASAGVEAHAWIECGGRPLNDREDVGLRFPPFDRAIGPC
jgi:hypothetical protein